jgi:secretion/DNA translocation related TadE-like protein
MTGRQQTLRDDGFATVWVVTAMALVTVAAVAAMGVGVVTIQRHRAAAAADAVALEVALDALDGSFLACQHGAELARLDGGDVRSCDLAGSIATVTVSVPLPGPLARWGSATGRARAGPAATTG